jgi:ATP-binding protein involved in chromosome partitioning
MSFRSYHQMGGEDRSGLLQQVQDQRARVTERLRAVKHVVAVMSGKGGVGKSHVTALLARMCVEQLGSVGVVDADLRSPTVARMLGAAGQLRVTEGGIEPAVGHGGIKVVSTDLLLDEGQPLRWREPAAEQFVWRNALEVGTLREFLADIVWGSLSLLLVDLPPGADGVIDLHTLVPDLTGVLIVTIPTDEARRSVSRTMRSAREAGIPLLGVIENMSGYQCGTCGVPGPLFSGNAGDALAQEFGVPLLGRLPFAPMRDRASAPDPSEAMDGLTRHFVEVLP